uniref:H(+)-exporting diphosphatase n=1 Tax=Haptolina brevifila TaxID=156173 RepID=A0A7S2GJG6_9EUKA
MTDASTDAVVASAVAEAESETGLPTWLDDLLKPGVSNGVIMTLKLSLVGLVIVLSIMLFFLNDPTVRMHVSIFLGMSVVLLMLVIWFIGELQKAMIEQKALEAEDQKPAEEKKTE